MATDAKVRTAEVVPAKKFQSWIDGCPLVVRAHLPMDAACSDTGVLSCIAVLRSSGFEVTRCSDTHIEIAFRNPAPWSRNTEYALSQIMNSISHCLAPGANIVVAVPLLGADKDGAKILGMKALMVITFSVTMNHSVIVCHGKHPWATRSQVLKGYLHERRDVRAVKADLDFLSTKMTV